MHQWRVTDQVIVVTGASMGIGLGAARCLLARGARVALLARDAARLHGVVEGLGSANALAVAVDVCDRAGVAAAFERIASHWGRLDGVINNVGLNFARRIEVMPEAEVRRVLELNFLGTVFGCQAAIPLLRAGGGGRIVNVSSSSVRDRNEFAHLGIYSASKAAVEQFTSELREELRADNILLTLFSSGSVFTGSVSNLDPAAAEEAYAAWLERGSHYGGSTTPEVMGEAIAQCFEFPPGVGAEFIEVRSGLRERKLMDTESAR
ncbi:MAG: SDR family oxidoreductase [Pseudomonadales bacterium]|nr:SDR family oxidoreductase [Pseudomonadales bacterium]